MTASASTVWSPEETVIWHDLECGAYGADLPLWLELAAAHPAAPSSRWGAAPVAWRSRWRVQVIQ